MALAHEAAAAQEPFVLPPALADAIKRLDSAASVVRADEILEERCGATHRRDQLFRADFNGDEGKPGEALRTAPLWAVVFLANRDGRYRPFILFKDADAMFPSRRVLWIQPPGHVHHGAHPERVLTLKDTTVGSMLCESTAKVFYWVGLRQTFREYLTKE